MVSRAAKGEPVSVYLFATDSPREGSGFEPSVPLPEIVVDPSGLRRDHRVKYGCLSARPRVRCLCPPGKTQPLLPKCSTYPGLIAGTWHRPLFLARDRWFESSSLHRRV